MPLFFACPLPWVPYTKIDKKAYLRHLSTYRNALRQGTDVLTLIATGQLSLDLLRDHARVGLVRIMQPPPDTIDHAEFGRRMMDFYESFHRNPERVPAEQRDNKQINSRHFACINVSAKQAARRALKRQ